jgi:molybdenum cofactor cytidylyltransferase
MLAAVILAAGESRRMGQPKALVEFRGRTFLERLLEATRHPRVGITRVVLGAGAEEIRAKLKLDPSIVVANPEWEKGQLSSIQAAIRSLPTGQSEGMLLCPVDHPLVSADLVATLIAEFDSSGKQIVLPVYHGRRGHPVIFHSDLYEELSAAPIDIGARAVVWAHAAELLEVSSEEEAVVLNLDDSEALRRATKNQI